MIAEELRLVVNAQVGNAVANMNKFSSTVHGATAQTTTLQNRLLQFGKSLLMAGGAVGAVMLLFRTVKESIAAFQEQEDAEAKLRAAIKATGKETQITARNIHNLASELQRTTTYGDDVTITAAAMLQQLADLDEKGLREIIPRVQNFAAAMGIDLETAATLVGKTLGSNVNALGRYGVQVDATAEKSVKLAALTKSLDAKFGGMADTLGKTASGQIKIFQNALSDLKEVAGEVFVNAIGPMVQSIIPLLERLSATISDLRQRTQDWEEYEEKGFGAVKNSAKYAAEAAQMYARYSAELSGLRKEQMAYLNAGQKVPRSLQRQIDRVKEYVDASKQMLDALKATSVEEEKAVKVIPKVAAAITQQADSIDMIDRYLLNHIPKLAKTVELQGRYNSEMLKGVELGQYQTSNYEQLVDLTDKYNAELLKGIDYTGQYIAPLKAVTEELAKQEAMMWAVVDAFTPFAEAFGTMIVNAEDGWEAFKDAAKGAIAAILEMLAKEAFAKSIAAFISLNVPLGIAWAAAGTAALVAAGAVKAMAEGGVVTGPTHALIGEAGPEAVIPLNKMGGMGGITIVINGSVMEEEGLARKIGGIISRQRRGY